jgi:hypothetical protein
MLGMVGRGVKAWCCDTPYQSVENNFIQVILLDNLMKLGGSLGNVPHILRKLVINTRYSDC